MCTSSSSSLASRLVDTSRRPCALPLAAEGSITSRLASPRHRRLQRAQKGLKRPGASRKPQCFFTFFPFFNHLSFAYALISTFSAHTQGVYEANSPAFARPLRCFQPVSRLQRSNFRRTYGGLPEVVPSLDQEAGQSFEFDPIVLGISLNDLELNQSSQLFARQPRPVIGRLSNSILIGSHVHYVRRKSRYFSLYVVSLYSQHRSIWDTNIK